MGSYSRPPPSSMLGTGTGATLHGCAMLSAARELPVAEFKEPSVTSKGAFICSLALQQKTFLCLNLQCRSISAQLSIGTKPKDCPEAVLISNQSNTGN